MPEYLTNTTSRTANLAPEETVEISFDPGAEGTIKMTSSSRITMMFDLERLRERPGELPPRPPVSRPTRRRMALIRPNGTIAVEKLLTSQMSSLAYSISAADAAGDNAWKLRVTNLDEGAAKFTATVEYPTAIAVKTLSVPLAQLNPILAGALAFGQIKLHLESGENDNDKRSYLDIQNPILREQLVRAGLALPYRLLVPKAEYDAWWWPKITARLKDVNTQSVSVTMENANGTFGNGFLRLNVRFEEQGTEIVVDNAPDVDLLNMNLIVDLGLAMNGEVLSYGVVDATFPVSTDVHGIPDNILSVFVNIAKMIRNAVESRIEGFLNNATLRQKTAEQLKSALSQISSTLGTSLMIRSVRVAGGSLTITYTDA